MLALNMLAGAIAPTWQLLLALFVGLAIMLVLIIVLKVHSLISILIGAIIVGLVAGLPLSGDGTTIISTVKQGMSSTLGGLALLVGLGSMFGAILEESGGAQSIANTMVKKFGEEKASWALGITGLVIAMPVFFDAGLIILTPLAFSIARTAKKSVFYYVIPLLAGLAVGHAFIPPTPGPILVADALGVDLTWVIIVGFIAGTIAMVIAGPLWGKYCGKKFKIMASESNSSVSFNEDELPNFFAIIGIVFIPLILIIFAKVAPYMGISGKALEIINFIGEPWFALLVATIAAMIVLGVMRGIKMKDVEVILTKSLQPAGLILLVTAAGGVLRYMLENTGIGLVLGNAFANTNMSLVIAAFIVAGLVRICVGSATVAMTLAAGIIANIAMNSGVEYSQMYLACVTIAIAGGSTICSHFNDSGFWLVKNLVGMDEKTTLKTWTIMETLVGTSGFIVALIISFFC